MAATSRSIHRTEEQRIAAQCGAYAMRAADGLWQIMDGDRFPVQAINSYLRSLRDKGTSTNFLRAIAYDGARLLRNAGAVGFYYETLPRLHFQTYWNVRIESGDIQLSSANTELSRLHGIYSYLMASGAIEELPYRTKRVEGSEVNGWRTSIVPDVLQRSTKKKDIFLPAPSMFRAFIAALNASAAFVAEIYLKTGLRLSELKDLAKKWLTRYESPLSGMIIVRVLRKGNREGDIYIPAGLGARIHAYLAENKNCFVDERGAEWAERTLEDRFLVASRAVGAEGENDEGIGAHTLRHAYASWAYQKLQQLVRAGKIDCDPILIVQELMGHASYKTTLETYIHLFKRDNESCPEDFFPGPIDDLINVMEVVRRKFPQTTVDEDYCI